MMQGGDLLDDPRIVGGLLVRESAEIVPADRHSYRLSVPQETDVLTARNPFVHQFKDACAKVFDTGLDENYPCIVQNIKLIPTHIRLDLVVDSEIIVQRLELWQKGANVSHIH